VAVNPSLPLSFKTSGRLLTLEVSPGDFAGEGELIATLDGQELQDAVTRAEQQLALAENSVAQAQVSLDELLNWSADETAVALAEANLAAAEVAYEFAQGQDATANYNLTSARINLERAERGVDEAQRAHEIAFDPGREWELYATEPSCLPGQGGITPCTGVPYRTKMEAERAGAERAIVGAAENLTLARASYTLAVSNLNQNSAVSAHAAVVNTQRALEQAQTGPRASEIEAARLRLEQAELSRQQARFNLEQARLAVENSRLFAPWAGQVLAVNAALGSIVGGGAPIITLMDTAQLQFHTSNLSERDLAQIEPGLPAQVNLKTYPGQGISGTVARVIPQASGRVGDAATFTVVIDLDETDLMLLAGMTGRVEIRAESDAG
jgi:multidrug resistance efflux pump